MDNVNGINEVEGTVVAEGAEGAEVVEVAKNPNGITVKDFAKFHNIELPQANAVLSFLASKGKAKIVGKVKKVGTRGKAASLYHVDRTVTIDML